MNKGAHSWLLRTGRKAVLATSIFAGEAMAQEQVPPPTNRPPATQEYADRIIELLKKARVTDDDERLAGLRELEQTLLLRGGESSQLMQKTRQEIIDTLTIKKLERKLHADNAPEAEAAAEALVKRWITHENYYLREQAKKVLDTMFAMNRGEDPRYRPPDVSSYTETIATMEPIPQLSEWADSAEAQTILKHLRERSESLDDDDYQTREQSSREITYGLIAMRSYINPLPKAVTDVFTAKHTETDWHPEWISLEKRSRAERILTGLEGAPSVESKLPAMDSNVGQVLSDMESHFGMRIDIEHISAWKLQHTPIEVIQGCNSYSDVLVRICEITKTYPVCGGHIRSIRLMPIDSKNPNVTLFPIDRAVAVLHYGTQKERGKLQMFMDPQLALLSVENAELAGISTHETDITIVPDGQVTWDVEHSGWKKPTRTKELEIAYKKEASITINAWVADNTCTKKIRLEPPRVTYDNGPHTYSCAVRQAENNKDWEAMLDIGIYEYLDWSKTPHESDTKTYCAAEAGDVVFMRADGSVIQAKRGALTINERRGTILFTLSEKPHFAKVTTFRKITQQEIQFPLHGGSATIKIIAPHFKVN